MEIFATNIEIYFTFSLESLNLQLEQTKFRVFPVFWQNFQIPCVFPDREFLLAIFPVFPVQWVPWTWTEGSIVWAALIPHDYPNRLGDGA